MTEREAWERGLKRVKRENREIRKHLRDLVSAVEHHLRFLDEEMRRPSDVSRGRRIAALANALDLQKQIAERFGLARLKSFPLPPPRSDPESSRG